MINIKKWFRRLMEVPTDDELPPIVGFNAPSPAAEPPNVRARDGHGRFASPPPEFPDDVRAISYTTPVHAGLQTPSVSGSQQDPDATKKSKKDEKDPALFRNRYLVRGMVRRTPN